ncbi:MAG: dehydratase [Desulfobulbaceae bacterium]|nr:dehydratase [Desulfofustis sp.]RZW27002.1 MAG: dehydratase [Desulfobulbaceae bacterium]
MDNQTFGIGCKVTFSKTVGESDIYLFAGITGDLSPNHVDREFMKGTAYGRRIAHGSLLIGYMSTASTMILQNYPSRNPDLTAVSLGYDRIRFLKPVFINDTITVHYEIEAVDESKNRSLSKIEITNQHGELAAVATHILKWVPNS